MDMIRDGNWPDEDDREIELETDDDAEYDIDLEDDDLDDGGAMDKHQRKSVKAQRSAHRDYRGARNKKYRHSRAA